MTGAKQSASRIGGEIRREIVNNSSRVSSGAEFVLLPTAIKNAAKICLNREIF